MNKITVFLLLSVFTLSSVCANDLMCNVDTNEYYAIYNPLLVNCSENQFLPANATECIACPDGYTCGGGALTFNENRASGIDYTKNITQNIYLYEV